MVEEIYQGEFFMHASDRSILQKSKRLMTSLKGIHSNPKYALLTFASNNQAQWSCMVGIMLF